MSADTDWRALLADVPRDRFIPDLIWVDADELASPQAQERLRTLNTVLEPLHGTSGVAELRHRLPAAA